MNIQSGFRNSLKVLLLAFTILLFHMSNSFSRPAKYSGNRLKIYFKLTECNKSYHSMVFVNDLCRVIPVDFIVDPEDKDFCVEILNTNKVERKYYTLRNITPEEKKIFNKPWSELVLSLNGYTYYGDYLMIKFLDDHLQELLKTYPSKPKLVSRAPGHVGIFSPFTRSGNVTYIFEPRLKKMYFDKDESYQVKMATDYFKTDSTYILYKIYKKDSAFYFNYLRDPANEGSSIISMATLKGRPVFMGNYTIAMTPLLKAKKRNSVIYFNDSIINRKDYTYIDNNSKLAADPYMGIAMDESKTGESRFYSFAWPDKKYSDSFLIASYIYSTKDTTWHQEKIYLLDTSHKGFDYSINLQSITNGYAVHSNLPILYSYPEVRKFDLSTVLSLAFHIPLHKDEILPKGYNIGKVWSEGKTVKLLAASRNELHQMVFYPEYNITGFCLIQIDYPFSKWRNMGYDEKGNPLLLFQAGKYHEVWMIE